MTQRAKHIIFSIIPVALLLVLLVVVELVLRLCEVAPPPQIVTEASYDGETWYQTNRAYLSKYFPPGTPLIPEFKTTLFRKEKAASTFRIMCLGSSSMFGTPYDMNANIPGIVRKQLRRIYPGVEFEVVNWGASAINSNVVRDLVPRLLQYQPDLVLVYMGHNEFYGPDGVGSSFIEKHLPLMTRVKYATRDWRLMRLLMQWLAPKPGDERPRTTLMREVSQGQLVQGGSSDEQRILEHFESNLTVILHTMHKAGVPVIVGTPTSNLMFPPFVSEKDPVDPANSAAGLYAQGVKLRSMGQASKAKTLLGKARDADLLKFRAPGAISDVALRVCAAGGVRCFSGDSVMSAASTDGIPGDTLFWEHLHPTAFGYYQLACAFVREILAGRYVREAPATNRLIPFDPDSLSLCWLDLAFGEYSIRHLTGNWPFENYSRQTPLLDAADSELRMMVAEVHARKRAWNEVCYSMATYFWRVGRPGDALTTYDALLEEYPYGFYTNYLKGSLLNSLGREDEAVAFYRRSIASNPKYTRAHLDLGLILVNRGEFDSAQRELEAVEQNAGNDASEIRARANARYGLAALRANKGDLHGALGELDEALRLVPRYSDAIRMRASLIASGAR
jgi:tetratricopeptide (TPR) repeat protein